MKPILLRLAGPLGIAFTLSAVAQTTFTSIDIGGATPTGQTIVTNGGFDVSPATGDILGVFDDFRFVYQQGTGDFDIRTRIANLTGVAYWGQAGIIGGGDPDRVGANGVMGGKTT